MSQSVTYRPATPTDQAEIQRVLRALHADAANSLTLPHIRQQAQTFVATTGDTVIGVAVATFVDYGHAPYGVLEELAVDPSARNAGTGTKLLNDSLTWLHTLGAEVVFVSAVNAQAADFYATNGFTPCTGPWLFWTPDA